MVLVSPMSHLSILTEFSGELLSCKIHECPQRCHQLQDHSKMTCKVIMKSTCPKNHVISHACHDKPASSCPKCQQEKLEQERKRKRDHEIDQERKARQRAYAASLAKLDDEMENQKRALVHEAEDVDRQKVLAQKRKDLAAMKERVRQGKETGSSTASPSVAAPSRGATKPPQKQADTTSSQSDASADNQATPQKTKDDANPVPPSNVPSNSKDLSLNHSSSEAEDDWEWQKKFEGADNEALDELMSMIGLEAVKQKFLAIKTKVDATVRQGISLSKERFGAALLGNPGTGKTTVARHYAKFLVKVGALPGSHFFETSGSALANEGVSACKAHIDSILEEGGGVFFIDEAYQLVSGNSMGGKAVLDYLLAEIENLTGRIVFVLAGYHKQMEAFFAHNPGIPSRIPLEMEFQDYEDKELHRIFSQYVNDKYKGRMNLEEGMTGLYARIVARRIGRGRGRDGFGNAREVQNRIAQITERQAKRLHKERKAGRLPDDYLLTKEDLIGPEPSSMLQNNAAWTRLQKLIGLESVKNSVRVLLDGIQFNYKRELEEKQLVQYSLNRCFIGSPGTGKTSVAKLYGRILADIGLLTNGEGELIQYLVRSISTIEYRII